MTFVRIPRSASDLARRLVRRYLIGPDLGPEGERAWQHYARERSATFCLGMLTLCTTLNLVWWLGDRFVLGDDPGALALARAWRLAFIGIAVAGAVGLREAIRRGRDPRIGVTAILMVLAALTYHTFARVLPIDGPWLHTSLVTPGFSIFVLVSPLVRILVVVLIALVTSSAYLVTEPPLHEWTYWPHTVGLIALSVIFAWTLGHLAWVLGRTYFATTRELERSELTLRSIVEHQTELVCRFLPNGTLTFANAAACEAFGRSADDLVGSSFLAIISPRRRAELEELIATEGARGPQGFREHRTTHTDGSVAWQEWIDHPIRDADGRVVEYQSVGRDVTLRRRTHQRLQRYKSRLQRVAASSAMREERERRRIAAELHDRVAQDLGLVKVNLGALTAAEVDPDKKQALTEVRGLVDTALGETRRLMVDLSPQALHELGLGAGLEWLAQQMEREHGIPCRSDIDTEVPEPSSTTSVYLFQSVRELLANVRKHAGATSVELSMRRGDGGTIEVSVSDDGDGFDHGQQQLGDPAHGGFGLFSIVDRADLMGGTCAIDSAVGRGSRITIRVPPRPPSTLEP